LISFTPFRVGVNEGNQFAGKVIKLIINFRLKAEEKQLKDELMDNIWPTFVFTNISH
jgi:hypothetical protein